MPHEFKEGDRVRVISARPPESSKLFWNPEMDATLGKEGTVVNWSSERGWGRVNTGAGATWTYLPEWLISVGETASKPCPQFCPGERVRVRRGIRSRPGGILVSDLMRDKEGEVITIQKYDASDDTYRADDDRWWASEWLEPLELFDNDAPTRGIANVAIADECPTIDYLIVGRETIRPVALPSHVTLINPTQLLTINNLD